MITKQDCLILLMELKDSGVNVNDKIKELAKAPQVNPEIVQFINSNRQIDLSRFYEKIRKSYNNKRSNLYINIVKDIEDPNEVLITLAALQTQILLFSKDVTNKPMFLKHSRIGEICECLNNYYRTFDITKCIKLLRIIKIDLKCLENSLKNH